MAHQVSLLLFASLEWDLPRWLFTVQVLDITLSQWLGLLVLVVSAVLAGSLGQWLLVRVSSAIARRTGHQWDDQLIRLFPGPLRILLALIVFHAFAYLLQLSPDAEHGVQIVVRTLLIVAVIWLVLRLITLGAALLDAYLDRTIQDQIRLRSLRTQIALPRSILRVAAILVGIALILLQFDIVRSVGVSLLASAGLVGVILGLAAQRAVGNLLAGIQVAFAQPIRIGDVVVVENEWGWVEEIGLTNVVIKVWDLRRLVLPVSYFLEKPFQNWTRGSSDLLGTVFVYVDYTIPVETVRTELTRILEQTPLWDRRTQNVQVTNLTERSVELRVMISAVDGGQLWQLRCLVREKLLAWLQGPGREHLPLQRVELQPTTAVPERQPS